MRIILAMILMLAPTMARADIFLNYPPFNWPEGSLTIPETSFTLHPDWKSPEQKSKEKEQKEAKKKHK